MDDDSTVRSGSGNVYADLRFDDPDMELAKVDLAMEIGKALALRGWHLNEAASVLGTEQPAVSNLMVGRLGEYSLGRLIQFLNRLNLDVRIAIDPNHSGQGTGRFSVERIAQLVETPTEINQILEVRRSGIVDERVDETCRESANA